MSHADRRGVTTIEIRVEHCARIDWTLTDDAGSHIWGHEDMSLSVRRRATVNLLADLLRYSTDIKITATDLEKTLDKKGENLYSNLLLVVGHELFGLLFIGKLRDYVFRALRELRDGELNRLRIVLSFTGNSEDWLASLPWEYTRTTPGDTAFNPKGVFLSERAELVLSRRLNMDSFRPLGGDQWPVRVLLVCSSPPRSADEGLEPVEAYGVRDKLEALAQRGVVLLETLIEPPPPTHPGPTDEAVVTREAFQGKVSEFHPVVVHFIGHGRCSNGTGELAFANPDGTVNWVDDVRFERDLSKSQSLRLVFLQACKSALPDPYVSFSGVARTVAASGVPAVVGMQYRITQKAANTFAEAFYEGIVDEDPVSYAVQAARNTTAEMPDDDHLAFGLPVLYLSEDNVLAHAPAEVPASMRATRLDRGDQVGETYVCPRCSTELAGPRQRFCQNCGLLLICPEPGCQERYADPINDKFCPNCQAPVRCQPPYADDALDVVAKVPDSHAARATLTLLRGQGGARG
ncbi:MAG: CHAT domain-containing protein [Solirubrobacteraceae bacterium]